MKVGLVILVFDPVGYQYWKSAKNPIDFMFQLTFCLGPVFG